MRALPAADFADFEAFDDFSAFEAFDAAAFPVVLSFFDCASALAAADLAFFDDLLDPRVLPAAEAAFLLVLSDFGIWRSLKTGRIDIPLQPESYAVNQTAT